jgi:SAM-dependent methyltransferase
MDTVPAEPWSHNLHYHRVVLDAIPAGCRRGLDVGCGTGALTRSLRRVIPQVTGIDRDERSVAIARAHPQARDIGYRQEDFLTATLEEGSFGLVTSVAALHHMDTAAALTRMAELLEPGGVLAVVGLARGPSPAGLVLTVPAVAGSRVHRATASRPSCRSGPAYQPPIVWPPPQTYRQTRRLAGQLLPGVRYRRHLYWRYSLIWVKPSSPVPWRPGGRWLTQADPDADGAAG